MNTLLIFCPHVLLYAQIGDEVPIVGSMVDRIMARPIPFVGEDDKESAESAQQVKAQVRDC